MKTQLFSATSSQLAQNPFSREKFNSSVSYLDNIENKNLSICGPVSLDYSEWYVIKNGEIFRIKGVDLKDTTVEDDYINEIPWFAEVGFLESKDQLDRMAQNIALTKELEDNKKHFWLPENKGIRYTPISCKQQEPKYLDYVTSGNELGKLTASELINYKNYMRDHDSWSVKNLTTPTFESCYGIWMLFFKTAQGRLR